MLAGMLLHPRFSKYPRGRQAAAGEMPLWAGCALGRGNISGDDVCFKKTLQEKDALPQLLSLRLHPAGDAH